jgi:hypothetical protein
MLFSPQVSPPVHTPALPHTCYMTHPSHSRLDHSEQYRSFSYSRHSVTQVNFLTRGGVECCNANVRPDCTNQGAPRHKFCISKSSFWSPPPPPTPSINQRVKPSNSWSCGDAFYVPPTKPHVSCVQSGECVSGCRLMRRVSTWRRSSSG